jgi:hypothetical protein
MCTTAKIINRPFLSDYKVNLAPLDKDVNIYTAGRVLQKSVCSLTGYKIKQNQLKFS